MLKDTLDLDSDDEYRLTGTETRPNEIVAVPMDRAGMDGARWRVRVTAGAPRGLGLARWDVALGGPERSSLIPDAHARKR
jgi:hypothetical protein